MGSLRDREVACSASDRQGSNFESCVWRTVSSHSSHHPQEVLLAQFSLYVHKGGLKPDSFHSFHLSFKENTRSLNELDVFSIIQKEDTQFIFYFYPLKPTFSFAFAIISFFNTHHTVKRIRVIEVKPSENFCNFD